MAGQRRAPRSKSDYALELEKRQAIKHEYGVKTVAPREELEARLDNVVFRMGIAQTRAAARKIVSHRHIALNDRRVSIPSIKIKVGDQIGVVGKVLPPDTFKKYVCPTWLKLNKKKLSAQVTNKPLASLPEPEEETN